MVTLLMPMRKKAAASLCWMNVIQHDSRTSTGFKWANSVFAKNKNAHKCIHAHGLSCYFISFSVFLFCHVLCPLHGTIWTQRICDSCDHGDSMDPPKTHNH